MRLISCYIENFGGLHNQGISFDSGESVIYEENGWGKSTLAAFIRIMFFGFDNEGKRDPLQNERSRFLPWQKGIYGGRIVFESNGRVYRLERTFADKRSGSDTCELYDEATNLKQNLSEMEIPGGHLGPFLFGIDSRSFQRTVFIGQQDCASADATAEINAKIGNISDQTADMANYEAVQDRLEKEMNRLTPKRKTGQISKLKMEAAELEGVLRTADSKRRTLETIELEIRQLRQNRKELQKEQISISRNIQKLGEDRDRQLQVEKYRSLRKAEEDAKETLNWEQDGLSGTIPSAEAIEEQIKKVRKGEKIQDSLKHRKENAELLRIMAAAQARPEENERNLAPLVPAAGAVLFLIGMILLLASRVVPGLLFTAGALGVFAFWFYLRRKGMEKEEERAVEIDAYHATEMKYNQLMIEVDADERAIEHLHKEVQNFLAEAGWMDSLLPFEELEGELQEMRRKILNIQVFWKDYEKKVQERRRFEEERTPEEMKKIRAEVENSVFRDTILFAPSGKSMQKLTEQLDQIPERLEQLSSRIPDLEAQADGLVHQLDQIERSGQQLEQIRSEISRLQHQYDVISRTRDYLEQARVNFTSRYMLPIRDAFQRYYRMISGNGADQYELDADLNIRVRQQGTLHETECLSEGSKDLVGLCRRMAMIEAMYEKEKPFLIFDDPFANLDDRRLAGALRFLDQIAEEYQILYFTCSESRIPRYR